MYVDSDEEAGEDDDEGEDQESSLERHPIHGLRKPHEEERKSEGGFYASGLSGDAEKVVHCSVISSLRDHEDSEKQLVPLRHLGAAEEGGSGTRTAVKLSESKYEEYKKAGGSSAISGEEEQQMLVPVLNFDKLHNMPRIDPSGTSSSHRSIFERKPFHEF